MMTFIHTEAPDMEVTFGGKPRLPPMIQVHFNAGPVVALRATELAIDTWDEADPNESAATIALRCRSQTSGRDMALYIEHQPADLRALAASLMRAADALDGGRGKQ